MIENMMIRGPRNMTHSLRIGPGFVVFVAGYIAILIWFKAVDIYHNEFSTPGALTAIYNFCRTVYIFYLFWIVYQVGNFLLTGVVRDSWKTASGIDRLAIGFFAGTGVCHAILLLLGYLGLYTVPVAIIITLPLVAFAYRDAATSLSAARIAIANWYAYRSARAWLFALALATAVAAAIALLLVKGLYPAGGHDYYLHYFSYYKSVIDRGGIWPTAHYVHGYDSKGDGLVFLSMLLTDAIAHQLVTFCFVAAGALALHQLLRRIAPATLWPLVGVTLYLSLYIYTPGMNLALSNGGWGDFEKWHEFETPLTIAILWLLAGCFEVTGGMRLLRMIAATSAVIAAVIIDYTFGIYLGLTFALLGGGYFAKRLWRDGWTCIGLGATAGATLSVMIATNYLTTGLFGDIGILAWWRFTNVDRLYQAGTLLQAINDYWSRIPLKATGSILSFETLELFAFWLRLELLYPLAASGLLAALIALVLRRGSLRSQPQAIVLTGAILAYAIFGVVVGRNGSESISFARYSSFTLPIVIAAGVSLWSFADISARAGFARIVLHLVIPIAVLAGCWTAALAVYPPGNFSPILVKAVHFALGRTSIDEAYVDQTHWPGRVPWGSIYPGARGAYAVVGPRTRVWSFHIHSYCMLPDCDLDVFRYVSMTGHDERVLFGTPEEAQRALKDAGLNYFLFSSELDLGDPAVAAPLFAPDNIAKYLGLRWTDGKTSLLTWLGPGVTPFSQGWLATYCHAVQRSPGFYWGAMRKVFADLNSRPHPWRKLDLPWAGNRPYESVVELGPPPFHCPPSPIEIASATYGQNCRSGDQKRQTGNPVVEGNVTSYVRDACGANDTAARRCVFLVDDKHWADPAPGCEKDFSVTYRCNPGQPARTAITAASAAGKTVRLDCNVPPPSGLTIRSVTYDGDCGATPGNAMGDLASKCDGKTVCDYSVNAKNSDDQAPKCNRRLVVSYSCVPDTTILRETLSPETISGRMLTLSCLREPAYNLASLPHLSTGQTLDFFNSRSASAFLSGWSQLEHWSNPDQAGAWSNGSSAHFGFIVDGSPAPKQAIMRVSVWFATGKLEQQRVQIWSAGEKLTEFDFREKSVGARMIDLDVPLHDITAENSAPVILSFYFPDAKPANQVTATSDGRALGIFVVSLKLAP